MTRIGGGWMDCSNKEFKFKLPEEPGLLTVDDLIRMKVEEELGDIEQNAMAEIFDTRDGKYSRQYRSLGRMCIAAILQKFA